MGSVSPSQVILDAGPRLLCLRNAFHVSQAETLTPLLPLTAS